MITMSRRGLAEAIVWILTLFFTAQMFAAPVRELIRRLTLKSDAFPP